MSNPTARATYWPIPAFLILALLWNHHLAVLLIGVAVVAFAAGWRARGRVTARRVGRVL